MPYWYYRFYDPLYILVALISLVLVFAAQIAVKSRYSKYSKINNCRRVTGEQAARAVLNANGIYDVNIIKIGGKLTDYYDPKRKVIALSEDVFSSSSIAAVGIAAHEAGHAVQHAENYFPVKARTAFVPFARFAPTVGIILAFLGFFINSFNLTVFGLVLYAATFVFQFITLPVEFNASRRAINAIGECNLLEDKEMRGAKKVLTAAALTYVAAMLQALLTLLYYAVRLLGNRRD